MVYLVDDDQDDIEILQEALVENSYKGPVLSFNNGLMLIERISQTNNSVKPAVIILDLNMPLLDGFQALKEIRKHPSYGSVPVVILTASSSKDDKTKSFELGCNFFMTKPTRIADYSQLATLVKQFIETANS